MDKERLVSLLGEGWVNSLGQDYLDSKEFLAIAEKISNLRKVRVIHPSRENVFRAFRLTRYEDVKAVMLGLDPYPNSSADGLSFSNSTVSTISPSLKNILKEIDEEYPENVELISHGRLDLQDLSRWARQGVLMLNTALTVEEHGTGSHLDIWKPFTVKVFEVLNRKDDITWLLLGNEAKKFKKYITNSTHGIVESGHPSPLNTSIPFRGTGCFRKVNELLLSKGKEEIIW